MVAPDPEKNSDVKYLTYPLYAGGNRGRGQVYPTGEKVILMHLVQFKLVKFQILQLLKKANHKFRSMIQLVKQQHKLFLQVYS